MNVKTILVHTRACLYRTGTVQALGSKSVPKWNSSEGVLGPEQGPGHSLGPAKTHMALSALVRRRPKRGTNIFEAIRMEVTRVTSVF